MSANLIGRDIQVGLEMAWHRKTKIVDVVTRETAFPYEIERCPIYDADGEEIPGWSYFRCTDDGKIAGKPVADTYKELTNSRFWEIIQNSVGMNGNVIETAGTLYDRSRRFVTIRLAGDGESFKVGEREFKNRMVLLDSIDGSTNFCAVNTSVCVVCANTFRMAFDDGSGEFNFKVKHTAGMENKLEGVEKAIDEFVGTTAMMKAALAELNTVSVKPETSREIFAGFLGRGEKLSKRSYNVVGRLNSLFASGKGNRGETMLDVFSAITDFYSHESVGATESESKQVLSSEYGAGRVAKNAFFRELFEKKDDALIYTPSRVNALASKGRAALREAEMVFAN